MGIPKFFRYISERWPMISEPIEDSQIAEFDNLYLDMNSILHNCTHSNDGSVDLMKEEEMFSAIFAYIEHLFTLIKPGKTFFMAIDGVAPRAKMNQQRSRRFRTAIEAEKSVEIAQKNGLITSKDENFDSNCITPGTEFMAKVTTNLKFFIHQKISSDAKWQKVQVILSGHEVPGEGEHKIMDYIRFLKAQEGYDPNTRHCIYGLDADLIMLGLVIHDPHFAILREEVVFGRGSKASSTDVSEQQFYLLHLSLLREYLALEFKDLEDQIKFDYDLERILDDFIFIMYVIGNDFLPNLPDLHINKGAFPRLLATIKETMIDSDGYLQEGGVINMERFGLWLDHLSQFELQNFEQVDVDVEWFNKQLENISLDGERKRERAGRKLLLRRQQELISKLRPWILEFYSSRDNIYSAHDDDSLIPTLQLDTELMEEEIKLPFIKQFALDVGFFIVHSKSQNTYHAKIDIDGINVNESDEEFEARVLYIRKKIKEYENSIFVEDENTLEEQKNIYDTKFVNWKNKYYKEKFGFTLSDTEDILKLTESYIQGLQWVLFYYYRGVPSWQWYYPYYYAPRISDIKLGIKACLEFDKGTPFKPFEQLMAVLPARSKQLVPACYRPLMTDPNSPIIEFYPDEVEIDKNGKTASWEAVVKINFVDEKRLLEALEPYNSKLNAEERQRNSLGTNIEFSYHPQVNQVHSSPIPTIFPDITEDHCYEIVVEFDKLHSSTYAKPMKGAKQGINLLAGFPTLKTIPFTSQLMLAECHIFNQPTKSESMILSTQNPFEGLTVEQFAAQNLGQTIYVNWPYLKEAKVVAVSDGLNVFEPGNKSIRTTRMESSEVSEFASDVRYISETLFKRKGVLLVNYTEEELQGTPEPRRSPHNDDAIQGIVFVKKVNGVIRTRSGAYVKTYSDKIEKYPINLLVDDVVNKDRRLLEKPPVPLEEEFPKGTTLISLGAFAYGTPATVVDHQNDLMTVRFVNQPIKHEFNYGEIQAQREAHTNVYYPSFKVAKIVGITALALSRITSSYRIVNGAKKTVNIGLDLKFEGRKLKVLGYTKRNEKHWSYSALAVNLLQQYQKRFPSVFKIISLRNDSSIPEAKELFPQVPASQVDEKVNELVAWVKEQKKSFVVATLESESLTKVSIGKIEQEVIKFVSKPHEHIPQKGLKGVPREATLDISNSSQFLSKQTFNLGDRVIYVEDSGKVPNFSKGTVIGVRSVGTKVTLNVLFDLPLLSGNTFDGRLATPRGVTVDSSLVLNLTKRQLIYHDRKPAKKEGKPGVKKTSQDSKKQTVKLQNGSGKAKQAQDAELSVTTTPVPVPAANTAPVTASVQATSVVTATVPTSKPSNNSEDEHELLRLLKGNKDSSESQGSQEPLARTSIQQIYGTVFNQVLSAQPQLQPVRGFSNPVPETPVNGVQANEQHSDSTPQNHSRDENQGRGRGRGRGNRRGRGRGRGKGGQ
ncbi:5'-3' exoribonuclease 1 [Komagataella phaffii CBS 7435]|uniref:5'-3' exoribonuclease 1 n=2 Tax=Komagataella phaffii TaxID=460519 RepID=C4R4J6_KOMPG|nr:Evolutionarily-conserved 5'-3' exonuclease component of cytoplasmic processing (P) bodies [Komagataella phaffii GS115]AOA63264.1 GQ67_03502T0 [Komagataella phaffii]CAH2449762.1 5'-3' exoribonuclease 1 [Komagataella phaffii CBS 7435]AOA68846.1 GQ68_03472T0 [Komagataella phaffii GS115]CAY70482.1 Evolutionarily-conserved 5'-3' exonuclease component of cytoplasmic processing (P) bodies [Komagataella phaffii GS115]CCA39734.1 5'-3' exoribonuclease 1 [Komagataella phaffii CBS 7435]